MLSKYSTHQETSLVSTLLTRKHAVCKGPQVQLGGHATGQVELGGWPLTHTWLVLLNWTYNTAQHPLADCPCQHGTGELQLIKWKGTALCSAHPCTAMVLLLDRTHTRTLARTHTHTYIYIPHTPPSPPPTQTKNKQDSNNLNTQVIQCKMQGVGTSPHQKSSTAIRYKSTKSVIYQF